MFRHKGKKRNIRHNLKIASLLSFVAGMVNTAGFFSVQTLTTNLTGHFAFFTDEIFRLELITALISFGYIASFFMGSFTCSCLMEALYRRKENIVHLIPACIEIVILLFIAAFADALIGRCPHVIAFALLYAMGMQNSFVTRISNSVVRTTHLTGLFTDLGIELARLFFCMEPHVKAGLLSSITLRLAIIGSFFTGGILGAVFYSRMGLQVLFMAGAVLAGGLVYDTARLKLKLLERRLKNRQ